MFLLDSTVVIELLNATNLGIQIQEEYQDKEIAITAFTIHEVLRGVHEDEEGKRIAMNFFEQLPVLMFDKKSAEKSVFIENQLRKLGALINQVDIFIAGICQENNAAIITLDKDFLKVPKLRVRMLEK